MIALINFLRTGHAIICLKQWLHCITSRFGEKNTRLSFACFSFSFLFSANNLIDDMTPFFVYREPRNKIHKTLECGLRVIADDMNHDIEVVISNELNYIIM